MPDAPFATFYAAVRDRAPFPWMERLAADLVAGRWPDVLALPTGTGKTDVVVVWAWALATARLGHVPRRLWMASDRRVIADQTEAVAGKLGQHLADPKAPAEVRAIADALYRLGGAGPLHVGLLRGGIVTDDEPLLDPVTPMVVATTVDQVGSRLLWRAYGAGPREWPIWAGLVGEDSLIVLDEAHLSAAAEATIRQARALGAGVRLLSMTATPRAADATVFALDAADRACPELRKRLEAFRRVVLRKTADAEAAMLAAATEALQAGCRRVAVVCNTVRRARDLFARLPQEAGVDRFLLIGRSRPLDRDAIMADLIPRVMSGAETSDPLVVVTTQCIEAGADFDFDAMVSEACPLDALRQRLGRLDRLGTAGTSRCVLVAPSTFDDAPPYGPATAAAWTWLEGVAGREREVDLGIGGWAALADARPQPPEATSPPTVPVSFLEPHLRMLARTWPRPAVEPEVDLLLHGLERRGGDISLVWRKDVTIDNPEAAEEILAILPPTALEAVQVPVWQAGRWLDDGADDDAVADIEGEVGGEAVRRREPNARSRPLSGLRWLGAEEGIERVAGTDLRPGDVIVVPADRGGCDRWGWAPRGKPVPVHDFGDEAWTRKSGRTVCRHAAGKDEDVADLVARERGVGRVVRAWSGGVVVFEADPSRRHRFAQGCEIPLSDHTARVVAQVKADAAMLGLDGSDLALAARWHDRGKDTLPWQVMIRGGDWSRCDEPPLAKGRDRPWRAVLRARQAARLPAGWRHEAESLRRLEASGELAAASDPDLVRWLVATHHGYGRPWWPTVDGAEPDPGLATLMVRLGRRHGWWRLAHYEALLRCADRTVSRQEALDNA